MKMNTNNWNKIRYTLYTPVYDLIASFFKDSRKKAIESLSIKAGAKILIVGAGTGLDIEFLPKDCEVIATDITPAMISKINNQNKTWKREVQAVVMDGQALDFPNQTFDVVILHLILAVIPDAVKCLKETERVLKPGGQISVFDKFVRKNTKVSVFRKFANLFTSFLFSDITRDFESIVEKTELKTISDEEANFKGNFRRIKLAKDLLKTKKQ